MLSHRTLSIAVISGKGGVGKSTVVLNLAYALYKAKQRVLLVDCDLGLANLDVLLGVTPDGSLEQLFQSDIPAESVAVELEKDGLVLIPAASGAQGAPEREAAMKTLLLERLNPYAASFEYLFLDAGAGISPSVQTLAALAALRIVVITPEPTSLTDGYALIKLLAAQHQVKDFHILVNQVEAPGEEKAAYQRLSSACERFLGFAPRYLGCVRSDSAIQEAVRRQKPAVLFAPASEGSRDLIGIAAKIHRLRQNAQQRLVAGRALLPPGTFSF